MAISLTELEALIVSLPVADQARLLEVLAPKVADAVRATKSNGHNPRADAQAAWDAFRRTGELVAAAPPATGESLTEIVTGSRR